MEFLNAHDNIDTYGCNAIAFDVKTNTSTVFVPKLTTDYSFSWDTRRYETDHNLKANNKILTTIHNLNSCKTYLENSHITSLSVVIPENSTALDTDLDIFRVVINKVYPHG